MSLFQPNSGSPARTDSARSLVRAAAIFYGVLAVAALGWRVGYAGESLFYSSPETAAEGVRVLRDLGIGLAAAALTIALSGLLTRRTRWGERLAQALIELVGPLRVGQILVLALLSGVGEEVFFRGALQPRVGWLWASLLFAAAHFVPRRDLLPWAPFSLLAGMMLGALFLGTGNLLAPIVAHATINAVNLQLLMKQTRDG